jgi:hypothetical protein
MSAHYVDWQSTPPGITSFTKIRLGWISPEEVLLIKPGENRGAFLAPLTSGGKTLVIKIPLGQGTYYLVEHRRPIAFDSTLPDSGILILKVDPRVEEGSGTVKIMDADPASPNFSHATFKLGQDRRNLFIDERNHVAVLPLWTQGESQGVLITTPEKSSDALKAAVTIKELWNRYPDPKEGKRKQLIAECVESFRRYEFQKSWQIGEQAL